MRVVLPSMDDESSVLQSARECPRCGKRIVVFEPVGCIPFDTVIDDMQARPTIRGGADVRQVLRDGSTYYVATGRAAGRERGMRAAHMALTSTPLRAHIAQADGVLIDISGPADLGLQEIYEAADCGNGHRGPSSDTRRPW